MRKSWKLLAGLFVASSIFAVGAYAGYRLQAARPPAETAEIAAAAPQPGALGPAIAIPVAAAPSAPASEAMSTEGDRAPVPTELLDRMPSLEDLPKPVPEAAQPSVPEPAKAGKPARADSRAAQAVDQKAPPIMALVDDQQSGDARGKEKVAQARVERPLSMALVPNAPKGNAVSPASQTKATPSSGEAAQADASGEAKKPYGWNNIVLVTSHGVVVATKEAGQREIKVGAKLPDGTTLRAVDQKSNKITTDTTTVRLTD